MKKIKPIVLFVVLGFVLIAVGSISLIEIARSQESSLVVAPPSTISIPAAQQSQRPGYVTGEPVALSIPSLRLDLQVIPGVYNTRTKTWTLTLDKVQYASMTPTPNNQSGNTFLYGHYRSNVFASLHKITAGAQATITTDNGHTFYYQLSGVRVVTPEDSSSVFNYNGSPILTLQTCTGLFFQNRQLFTFNLVKVA